VLRFAVPPVHIILNVAGATSQECSGTSILLWRYETDGGRKPIALSRADTLNEPPGASYGAHLHALGVLLQDLTVPVWQARSFPCPKKITGTSREGGGGRLRLLLCTSDQKTSAFGLQVCRDLSEPKGLFRPIAI
jgi:hypothetical protein